MRLFEINTRVHGRSFASITDEEMQELVHLGFDAIWPMGVWEISKAARRISKVVSEDWEGSPYAVPRYKFNKSLGGKSEFTAMVRRARQAGLAVIVDFVSNHMAIDSAWIDERPDLFIASDPRVRKQETHEYFLHRSAKMIAFGRDPFFPPWNDTAQLDYSNPATRKRMIDTLLWISRHADGVRCDMAMLVLRDYIRAQWYPLASDADFDARMAGEFWDEAIKTVKKRRPDFKFIAEAYWDKEPILKDLGFDLCYEKRVLDGLVAHDAQQVLDRLTQDQSTLRSSIYFVENHDEARAAAVFDAAYNLAAAALILGLPGSALIHEGQMEGKREKLPVQRIKPLTDEAANLTLRESYKQLLTTTSADVFKNGAFELFDTGVFGVVSYLRQDDERTVAYIGQISDGWHRLDDVDLDVTAIAARLGEQTELRLTNLLNCLATVIPADDGAFRVRLGDLGLSSEDRFCLLAGQSGLS